MSQENGATTVELLFAACRQDNLDLLNQVLAQDDAKEMLDRCDHAGLTGLCYASRKLGVDCLIALLDAGANPNLGEKMSGDTPLHHAMRASAEVLSGNSQEDESEIEEMVRQLINAEANLHQKNRVGITPLELSQKADPVIQKIVQQALLGLSVQNSLTVNHEGEEEEEEEESS